ncbi:S-layer homology domain-containing protein [Paenibacillus rubinfantis]|uniref:S-layer homology domain-containing protein n=1 Tax=Paenibacillus rubinfantis TaxID=1720296 RepID=UPI00073E9D11|nr:S-layer homology domain-containing protein [Paenibacillus rubinfantis]
MKTKIMGLLMAVLLCFQPVVSHADSSTPSVNTKTTANFNDLKDLDAATKEKFDAMISAGIFEGVAEGNFGLKDEMNRAQFAKVAALIFGLQVDTSLKTSSFKDVKSDDPANGYALPFIEAVKEAGITKGTGPGVFNPGGEVTKEQLATFLIRGLGKEKEAQRTPGVDDSTVSDWAKNYVALALELKLMSNGEDGVFGGSRAATRDLLVLGSYEAKQEYDSSQGSTGEGQDNGSLTPTPPTSPTSSTGTPPVSSPVETTLSIVNARQTGAKTFYVQFSKYADPATVRLSVTRNGSPIAVQTTADQANGYKLTFAENVQEGQYMVTAGYTSSSTVIGSVPVDAVAERVARIDFASSSDTIAKGSRIGIPVKAINQFGETLFNYSEFVVLSGVPATIDPNRGLVVVDTSSESLLPGISMVSITLLDNDSHVTASKNFKVGSPQYAMKVEFQGSLRGMKGQEVPQAEWGQSYHVNFDLKDQYGNLMMFPLPSGAASVAPILTPYSTSISVGALGEAPVSEPGSFSLPITFDPTSLEGANHYTLTLGIGGGFSSVTFPVVDSEVQVIQRMEIKGSIRDATGQEVTQVSWPNDYHLNFDVYDQNDQVMSLSALSSALSSRQSQMNFTITPEEISLGSVEAALPIEPGALSLPFTIKTPERAGNVNLEISIITMLEKYQFNQNLNVPIQIVVQPKVAMPTLTQTDGGGMVLVMLSTTTPDATIYYTEDGVHDPSTNPQTDPYTVMYNGPFYVPSGTWIKAIAVKDGSLNSDIMTEQVTLAPSMEFSVTDLVYIGEEASGMVLKVVFSKPVDPTSAESGAYLWWNCSTSI